MSQLEINTFQVSKSPAVIFLMVDIDQFKPVDILSNPLTDNLISLGLKHKTKNETNSDLATLAQQSGIISTDDPVQRYIDIIMNGHPIPPIIAAVNRCGGTRIVNNDHSVNNVLPSNLSIDLLDGGSRLSCLHELSRRGIPIPSCNRTIGVMLYCGLSWSERMKFSLRLRPHKKFSSKGCDAVEAACTFGEYITAELAFNEDSPLKGQVTPFGPISISSIADTIAGFSLSDGRFAKMFKDDDVGGSVEIINFYLKLAAQAMNFNWHDANIDMEIMFARCMRMMKELDSKIGNNFKEHKNIFEMHGKSITNNNIEIKKIVDLV